MAKRSFKTQQAPYYRSTDLEVRVDEDDEGGTMEYSWSSEYPVERYYDAGNGWERGLEVLSHKKRHVRLGRLRDGAPLLVEHDSRNHAGVIERVTIDEGDRVGRAKARFSSVGVGPEARVQVAEGVKRKMSVGYRVYRVVREDPSEEGGMPTFRAVDWEPFEHSLVAMPADPTVGVGRAEVRGEDCAGEPNDVVIEIEEIEMSGKDDKQDENVKVKEVRVDLTADQRREAQREAREEERARSKEILALGRAHDMLELAQAHVDEGASLEDFRAHLLDKLAEKAKAETKIERLTEVGLSDREKRDYSLVRAIRAAGDNDWRRAGLELEASQAVEDALGKEPRGFFIPPDIDDWPHPTGGRNLTVGSAVAGGNLKGTDHLGNRYVDALRERVVVVGLGATILDDLVGDVAIPAANAMTTTYWVAEDTAPTEGAPTYRQITMSPKTIAAYVDMSRKLLIQSSPSIEQLVRADIVGGVAIGIDKVAVQGGGTNEPVGVLGTTGIGAVALGTNGGNPTWGAAVNLMKEVDIDNALMGALSYLGTPHSKAAMMQTPKQTSGVEGNFIMNNPAELVGFRFEASNVVPSTLAKGTGSNLSAVLFGNWNDLLIGQWSGADILVDPYSLSTSGALRMTIFQDVDVAVRRAQSFAAIQDMIA